MQKITIFAKDSFGAETMVDLNGADGTRCYSSTNDPLEAIAKSSLVVEVNAPPRLAQSMPDVFLYRTGRNPPSGQCSRSFDRRQYQEEKRGTSKSRISSRWNTSSLK